ncbi:MAG: DNA polymerase III subunit delta' [Burkholderiales bacterium]
MIQSWQTALFSRLSGRRQALPHALLLHGRVGLGKTDFALTLAQSLLCETPQDSGEACGQCAACRWFDAGHHPDFRWVSLREEEPTEDDAATEGKIKKAPTQIGVDAIRALSGFMTTSTHRQGMRIVLIAPADALNANAANALLKTLEEPLPDTLMMLVSDEPGRLAATIRSRCQNVCFDMPPAVEAEAWLAQQGIKEAPLFLALAGGAPLEAQRLAMQDTGLRAALLRQLSNPEASLTQLSEQAIKMPTPEWIGWLQRLAHDLVEQKLIGRPRYHLDFSEALGHMAQQADLYDLLSWEHQLREARRLAQHPLNARLLAESLLVPMLAMR